MTRRKANRAKQTIAHTFPEREREREREVERERGRHDTWLTGEARQLWS